MSSKVRDETTTGQQKSSDMINLLKDNKGNTLRVETCKYCNDFRGKPKLILPEDLPRAIRMPDGSYKCEPCQIEEIQNKIVKVTPNSPSAKQIITERAAKQKKDLEFKKWDAKVRKMKIDHKRSFAIVWHGKTPLCNALSLE
jgi:hypothetical protein